MPVPIGLRLFFLINLGNAKAKDIETLGMIVQERVMNKLNILLEWEIKIIGNITYSI